MNLQLRGYRDCRMIYDGPWLINLEGETFKSYDDTCDDHLVPSELIIMLWSGLNDNYGKKIYEGDIVEYDGTAIGGRTFVAEVFYTTDMTLSCSPGFGLWVKNKGYSPMELGDYKVIGNKYENPELLK